MLLHQLQFCLYEGAYVQMSVLPHVVAVLLTVWGSFCNVLKLLLHTYSKA